jgi:oligopeptidase B
MPGWRTANWQVMFKDPSTLEADIRAHLEAENAYQEAALADTSDLRKKLFAEMKGRIKEDDSSVPSPDGPFAYGTSFVAGGEQPRFFREARDGSNREIILDGDLEAAGKSYLRLSGTNHSPDHRRIVGASTTRAPNSLR